MTKTVNWLKKLSAVFDPQRTNPVHSLTPLKMASVSLLIGTAKP